MRLICPNCDAQYEVVSDIIPRDGRDVQCSNCGKTWFQHHPDHIPEEEAASDVPRRLSDGGDGAPKAAENPRPSSSEPQRRSVDASVADILRQEAELEARNRSGSGLESQPELGLETRESDTDRRAREARDRMARMRGEDNRAAEAATAAAVGGSRRDLLPDIDEINSTLRSTSDRKSGAHVETAEGSAEAAPKRRSGFRRGFLMIIVLALILIAIYIFAPKIAQALPQADPYLSAYVAKVDSARSWLDAQVTSILSWLDAKAKAQSQGN